MINDPRGKATHELDAVGVDPDGRILCLGEAKLATVMNAGHLDRLRRARRLLESAGHDVARTRLLCFSAAGFGPDLRAAASEGEAVLVDLDRIYTGS